MANIRPLLNDGWRINDILLYLAKILSLFFFFAIPTISTFVCFHFVLLSQVFHFVYAFFDSEFITLGLKLY